VSSFLSGKRLAAVDVQRLTGEEGAGQGEQHAPGDVVGGPDPARGVTGADVGEVVGLALLAERVPRSAPEWPELTESELAVVGLVTRGATNREVAERLYLSPYTVNSHLRHVFTKLGIRSRTELAHLVVTRGMPAESA
jgi:DNA-binding CsgD family transcriptional regulator